MKIAGGNVKAVDAVFIGSKLDRQEPSQKNAQGRPAFLSDVEFARIVNSSPTVDGAVANLASRFELEGKTEPAQGFKSYMLARASRLRTQHKNGESDIPIREFPRGRPTSAATIQRQMAKLQVKLDRASEPPPIVTSAMPVQANDARTEAKRLMLEET